MVLLPLYSMLQAGDPVRMGNQALMAGPFLGGPPMWSC